MQIFTVTTTYTKPNVSVPWYQDSISNTSPEYALIPQMNTLVREVPGVLSYESTVTDLTSTHVLEFKIEPGSNLADQLTTATGTDIHNYITSQITAKSNNQSYSDLIANIWAYRTANSITSDSKTSFRLS
jgi:hypothetical protein